MFETFTGYLLTSEVLLESNGGIVSTAQGLLLFGGLFLLVGFGLAYAFAGSSLAAARQYLQTEPLEDATSSTGPVAISGQVSPLEEPLTGPLTGDSCVVFEYEELELERDFKYDREERIERSQRVRHDEVHGKDERERRITTWVTQEFEREAVPFEIDTATGPVVVEVSEDDLDLPERASQGTPGWRRHLHRFAFIANLADKNSNFKILSNPKRDVERSVKVGETVQAYGVITDAEDGSGGRRLEAHPNLFLVSTRPRWRLVVSNVLRAVRQSLPGFVFVAVGALLMLLGVAFAFS